MAEVGHLFPVAVVFIVFNRPRMTRLVFASIAALRPAKLLLIADGARAHRPGDQELCRKVREIVTAVDWPCEVLTNFAQSNLGCCSRIVSGLDWAFSLVEEAIILEDDCLPDASFFPFCQQLLERYKGDARIAAISGTNLVGQHHKSQDDYYFSQLGGNWGWATWAARWREYDRWLKCWPDLRSSSALAEIFDRRKDVRYWTRIFDSIFAGSAGTWDYQWLYTNLFGHKLIVVPGVNLIRNIGFGVDATHTHAVDPRMVPCLGTVQFPLRHPAAMVASRSLDRHYQKLYYRPLSSRIGGRIRRLITRREAPLLTTARSAGSS